MNKNNFILEFTEEKWISEKLTMIDSIQAWLNCYYIFFTFDMFIVKKWI
jgi:hypothetical protein